MQRSSESIAQLAGALAKAQIELTNPEKTLEATIYPERTGQEGRTFKYASLASGLDIVRKTLGEHEIATVQTTAIDAPGQMVTLTTVLAHSSGEWIASDWPVCGVAETATPQRMGEALTYARRYALFTLVGIAGEDDLDAPDLQSPRRQSADPPRPSGPQNGHLNGGRAPHNRKSHSAPVAAWLGAEQSAELRDRLVSQIAEIGSAEDAALWAYCNMRAKNGLSAADALQVEEAFQGKLSNFRDSTEGSYLHEKAVASDGGSVIDSAGKGRGNADAPGVGSGAEPPRSSEPAPATRRRRARRTRSVAAIDKALLAFPEPRRIRDREHVRFVAKQPCLICGRIPSDPHHLRFTQNRALGRKVSDEFTVPLCRGHHREVHRHGDEAAWWKKLGIDPAPAARRLWLESHPLPFGPAKENDESLRPSPRRGRRAGKNDRAIEIDSSNYETKPIPGSPTP